jgi:hypothetical protein
MSTSRKLFRFILPTLAVLGSMSANVYSQTLVQTVSLPASVTPVTPQLGTLFFSRNEREQMDRPRAEVTASNVRKVRTPAPQVMNGFVKRSDGTGTVWVDEQMRSGISREQTETLDPRDVGGESIRVRQNTEAQVPSAKQSMPKRKAARAASQSTKRTRRSE